MTQRFMNIPNVMVDEHRAYIEGEILRPAFDRYQLRHGNVWDRLFTKLDAPVSIDPCHLKKMPMTLHQDTLYLCIPLPPVRGKRQFNPERDSLRPQQISIDLFMFFLNACVAVLDDDDDD